MIGKDFSSLTIVGRPWTAAIIVGFLLWILAPQAELQAQESPHGKLSLPCETCHTPLSWKDISGLSKFDHATTGFVLVGQHAQVQCSQCHASLKFEAAATNCADCHKDVHRNELGNTCDRCHSPQSWLVPDMAQRHSRTRFNLMGPHATLPCQACHVNQQKQEYVNVSVDCIGCHRTQFVQASAPSHQGFSTDCTQCHAVTAMSWNSMGALGAQFNHASTGFPLTGAHASQQCVACHANNTFKAISTDCSSCHLTQFTGAVAPRHVTGLFSNDCSTCHTTTSWRPSTFDHNTTAFILTGAHTSIQQCADCHTTSQFASTPTQCVGCHQTQFTATSNPLHTGPAFSTNCVGCHTTVAWNPAQFDHSKTNFPLTGGHAARQCADCHANNQFAATPTQCVSCHQSLYMTAAAPQHTPGISTDCTGCHTTTAWQPSTFNHTSTGFTLTGFHSTSVACAQCHASGVYANTATTCVGCHLSNFNTAVNPSHNNPAFNTDCASCHSTSGWHPASFDHSKTSFPLTGGHASRQCIDCHANNQFASTPTQCVACHQTLYTTAAAPQHSPGLSTDCTGCHNTTAWQPSAFNHATTGFTLTGAHGSAACAGCHASGVYSTAPQTCDGCHMADYNGTINPNHKAAGFASSACVSCHSTAAWPSLTFDHSKTNFPLTGSHQNVKCMDCHAGYVFAGRSTACFACHSAQYVAVVSPKHVSSVFSTDCTSCHTTGSWTQASFDHSKTAFPLTGAHASRQCADCHKNSQFASTPVQCFACHQSLYMTAAAPVHTPGISTDCTSCHNTTAWQPSNFNHSSTGFVLLGAHTTAQCAGCHTNGVYSTAATTCVGCHISNFNSATNPNHPAAKFPTDCTMCHNNSDWMQATFDHSKTAFPLVGAHAAVGCDACHAGGVYAGRSTACFACHSAQYVSVVNPKHVSSVFSTDCTGCHTMTAWNPASFDHNKTAFPLTGAHAARQCADCHKNSQFSGTPVQCYACHQTLYTTAAAPKHSPGISTDCTGCHNTTAWQPSTFNHSSTGFTLTGFHLTTATCAQCHAGGVYSTASTTCDGCHMTNYTGATNPVHSPTAFPLSQCATCHSTTAWTPATFDHSTSGFPLTGAHAAVTCVSCHVNNNYNLTSTQCYTCHQTQYTAASTVPVHSPGLSTDCTGCHNTTAWLPSTFNHTTTGFTLTGFHSTSVTCAQCHASSGVYSTAATTCDGCHITDYNNTNNPVHSTAGFPASACATCHTTTSWAGATFNHTWFPQTHGNSGGTCSKCHTVASDYTQFSCVSGGCHPKAQTDSNHQGKSGYQYLSSACYSCHPRGNGG